MNKEEFYKKLDLETGDDFQYFENFAQLVENDEEIEADLIYQLLKEIDLKLFQALTKDYFEDLMDNISQDEIDLYNLLETIKRNFIGMAKESLNEDENAILRLADELAKFQKWLSVDKNVIWSEDDKITKITLGDALAEIRASKFSISDGEADFSKAMEYSIEEFIMYYGDLVEDDHLENLDSEDDNYLGGMIEE